MSETVNISEFARRMGVNEKLIRRAINDGKISAIKEGRTVKIDFDVAKKEFEDLGLGRRKGLNLNDESKYFENLTVENAKFSESKRREAFYKSELCRLEMESKSGKLVDKEEVDSQLFDFGKEIRNKILSIPDRITDELITLKNDRHSFYKLLYDELVSSLKVLADKRDYD